MLDDGRIVFSRWENASGSSIHLYTVNPDGSGLELLRVSFERPVAVNATAGGGSLHCTVELGGLERCEIQLAFQQERAEAATLAAKAEELEKARDLGSALATWTDLLDRFPFERKLVARAEEARARLVQTGLEQVGEVRRGLVQARFFLLPELFRKGEARALELAAAYRGSEVEAEARKAAEECRMALTELAAGGRSGEAQRLRGVLEALHEAGETTDDTQLSLVIAESLIACGCVDVDDLARDRADLTIPVREELEERVDRDELNAGPGEELIGGHPREHLVEDAVGPRAGQSRPPSGIMNTVITFSWPEIF